jgi:hypothetical protein
MVSDEPHIAATTAVAAVGSTLGYVGFATKRNAARSSVTSTSVQLCLVDKRGHGPSLGNPEFTALNDLSTHPRLTVTYWRVRPQRLPHTAQGKSKAAQFAFTQTERLYALRTEDSYSAPSRRPGASRITSGFLTASTAV